MAIETYTDDDELVEPGTLDLDSIEAVRDDLIASVTAASGSCSLHASSAVHRMIAASRIAWLASRLAWLEASDLDSAGLAEK